MRIKAPAYVLAMLAGGAVAGLAFPNWHVLSFFVGAQAGLLCLNGVETVARNTVVAGAP